MTSEYGPVPHTVAQALAVESFPRASTYDPAWVVENQMGPNVLWLTEYLTQSLDLQPGMRVLDLGCGKGMSSVFLAREFGVQVWATDLWIGATDNRRRIEEAGLGELVFPVHAEAHALPYGEDFFDAVVSIDAYQYFGTDDLYLGYLSRFVKPGGQIGIVVPGLAHEIGDTIPESLASHWVWDFWCWHSSRWWLAHWQRTGLAERVESQWMPEGWELWMRWESLIEHLRPGTSNIELLRADADRLLGFVRVVGQRRT